MNKFFYPGTEKIDKPGLERHHQLIESSTLNTAIKSQKKVRESLPNNWIYNDNKANEVWSELEQFESCPRGQFQPEGHNPYAKIDESAAKIRKTITNFEIQDQEFLMELMELMDDDSFVDSLDQSSILYEAKYRLQKMIEEHIDFGERQATLISNLTSWFTDVKNKEQDEYSSISSLKTPNSEDKITQLKKLIEDYKEMSTGQIEKVENLHEDIIQNLSEKVTDCKKIISQKDLELNQMTQNLQQANSKRKNGRSFFNVRDSIQYDAELAFSQRKVMELQEQLNTLRVSLSEYTKLKNSDSMREIMLMANLTDQNGDNNENSSLKSERNSVLYSNFNTNDMNFTKLKEPTNGLISVEREIEFESKLCVLANQIKNLKDDNKSLSDQIMQNRQSDIINEKRYQSIERQKKTMESALQSVNKKMANMKENYERKIKELQNDPSSGGMSVNAENESILQLKNSYESRIDKISEDYRKQIQVAQEAMDKKYQKQVADVLKLCKNGDASAALEQVTTNFQQQVLEMERHFDKELKNEKRKNAERIVSLTKHYEAIIKKKDKEIERIKNSVESELKSRILDVQIELDDKFNAKSFEDNENAVNEYNEIRRKMQGSIDHLKEKLLKVTRERDTLKSLIEANDLALDLMDDLNANDGNGNEEEEDNLENGHHEDDILQNSLFSLKEKETEKKLSEKYSLIIKAEKENLQEYQQYELENAKKFYQVKFQQLLNEFREKVVSKANEISDKMLEETESIDYQKEIENLLVETVKLSLFDSDYELEELFRNPTIPLSEVDNKVNSYRSQVIALTSENEFWKTTFKHYQSMQNDGNKSGNNDDVNVIDSIKAVLEKQSKRMAEIDKENRTLNEKLHQLPSSKLNLLDSLSGPNEICNLIDFHQYDNYNNTSNSFEENTKSMPTNEIHNKSSNNISTTINTDQICCFHCHSSYSPQQISQQIIKCRISKCPQCSHLCLMPQNDEITILREDEVANQLSNQSTFNSGDISLPTKPNLDSLSTTTTTNEASNNSIDNNNIIIPLPNQRQQIQQLKQQHNQKLQDMQQSQEKLKFELQFQQEQNQQAKLDLEKAQQRNKQLKSKLVLYEKNFGDLEKQYIKKINKMNKDLSILQHGFIEDSIFIVNSAQQLPNDQQENLEKKISVSKNIAQMLTDIEFTSDSTTKTNCQQFIDFTNEKLNEKEENESKPSFEDANEALNQAESLLYSLLTGSFAKSSQQKSNSNEENNEEINDNIIIEDNSILMCKLNVFKMNVDTLKEHNEFVAGIVKEVLTQFKEMSSKIKQIGKSSIGMAQNMKIEMKKVSSELNSIIEQKTKAINEAKRDLLSQKTAYDLLQEKFRTSVTAFEKLQINSESNKDEVTILKRKEDDQSQMIDALTNKLLNSQENNRKLEREVEELKLKINELESDQLLITARIETQANPEIEADENDESYQSSHNEEENQTEETNQIENEPEPEIEVKNTNAVSLPAPLPSIGEIQQTNPEISYEFVPSFVIFSTGDETDSNRKKGFSLLPRRLALQQSKPVSMDLSLNSPQSNSPTTQPPKSANQEGSTTVEGKPLNAPKHEKIRIKYVQNNFSSTSASNARVIVPKSRPKTTMNRTTSSIPSTPPLRTNTPVQEEVKIENEQPAIPRVLSFENLIPLSEDDTTGSLIGYITHYVPILPPGKSLEDQAKLREEKRKILRTSSVLISEVPPDKLRLDNNNNNAQTTNANANQVTAKSLLNFGMKLPFSSNPNTNSNVTNMKSSRNQRNPETSKAPRTKEVWFDKLEKKIKTLENQLREASSALQDERDKSHRAIQEAFKTKVELRQSQRQQKKSSLLLDATKKRLEQALIMVSKSDNEISRLKKLLNEVSHLARVIEEKETANENDLDDVEEYQYRAFPTKKRVHKRLNKLSVSTNFEEETNRLLSVFRGVSSGLTNMAEKEIESIRKWAPKKDRYINNEQVKLISALEAMRFITSPENYEEASKKQKSLKKSIHVKSFEMKQKKQQAQKRPASKPIIDHQESKITVEKAIVTANMHHQKLNDNLKKGVIGRPATSHNNIL